MGVARDFVELEDQADAMQAVIDELDAANNELRTERDNLRREVEELRAWKAEAMRRAIATDYSFEQALDTINVGEGSGRNTSE